MICDPAWRLPGPSRFLDDIAEDLHDGASLIVGLAARPPLGLRSNLAERLRELGLRRQVWMLSMLDADGRASGPETLLMAGLGAGGASFGDFTADLFGRDGLSPDVYWIEGLCQVADDGPWCAFLRRFAHVARDRPPEERPCLVVPVDGPSIHFADIEDIGLRRRDWQGRVTPLDVALFAAQHLN